MDNYADYENIPAYRQRANIEAKFQRNVCVCVEPEGLVNGPAVGPNYGLGRVSITNVEKKCHRVPAYLIFMCSDCGDTFLHDFHQNFCYKKPLCWGCNRDNKGCENHLYCVTNVGEVHRIPPTIKLKVPFTDEELEAVFDFE